MARFLGKLDGQQGEARRLGNAESGIRSVVNGWSVGVCVIGHYDKQSNKDVFHVYRTGGTNGSFKQNVLLLVVTEGV